MGVPLTKEEFVKRHKADLQALGFDIQFLAFVIFLLDIKEVMSLSMKRRMTLLFYVQMEQNGLFK